MAKEVTVSPAEAKTQNGFQQHHMLVLWRWQRHILSLDIVEWRQRR